MLRHYFVINAPPLSFSKSELYLQNLKINSMGSFIKAISDAFFLSNQFRKNNFVYYCTEYKKTQYIVTFNGETLKYLGPSFFSSAHLLLRAKNHIKDSKSRSGKLTPGLSVYKKNTNWIFEKHAEDIWINIIRDDSVIEEQPLINSKSSYVFFYNFESKIPNRKAIKLSLGPLDIDEQVILTNYYIESLM
jgi:hypothetical protein